MGDAPSFFAPPPRAGKNGPGPAFPSPGLPAPAPLPGSTINRGIAAIRRHYLCALDREIKILPFDTLVPYK